MEEQLKKTVADYLKIDASAVGSETVIDRSALGNSIMVHRMYASFSQQGFNINNYNTIRTYGDLKNRLSSNGNAEANADDKNIADWISNYSLSDSNNSVPDNAIGIDIEEVNAFEAATDFREHSFYKDNFTQREISYCLLQSNPRVSFAGLFAAKEALIKADNALMGTHFSDIEITHEKNGQPRFRNFSLSISHTSGFAAAVATKTNNRQDPKIGLAYTPQNLISPSPTRQNLSLFSIATFILSLAAFILALFCLLRH